MGYNPSYTSSGGKNGTAGAAAAAAAAAERAQEAKFMAKMLARNQKVPQYYAIAIAGLIFLFTLFHWIRFLYSHYASSGFKRSPIIKGQVAITRLVRRILIRRVPGFTSAGHALLVLLYLGINIALTVTNVNWSTLQNIGRRLGWITITNLAFITFLALKNTPLAFLTAYSYDRLNCLHQVGGYTTVTAMFLHATMISLSATRSGYTKSLKTKPQYFAMTAASAALVILITATIARRIVYEVFYVTHICMYILILISVGQHQSSFQIKAIIVTLVAASIWFSDRIIRASRILWYSHNNKATLTPLSNGGTRIVLSRSPSRAAAGAHCFLWIPKIRTFETHPFTIVSAGPRSMELVVASYDGFTKDLHSYAKKNPGVALQASVDGPYGAIPNFANIANKVIFVAGGSGASFTFGLALDLVKQLGDNTQTTVDFIWAVKEQESLSWFSKELAELQSYRFVNVFAHTTRYPSSTSLQMPPTDHSPTSDGEKSTPELSPVASPRTKQGMFDVEKPPTSAAPEPWDSTTTLNTFAGRPDVPSLIRDVVAHSNDSDRIAIAACGPDSLMSTVRATATSCISLSGPSIELHCEQFGW